MASLNLIDRNFTFARTYNFYLPRDENSTEKGASFDLTGIIITWYLITEVGTNTYVNGSGLTIDYAGGSIVLSLDTTITAAFPEGHADSYFTFEYVDGVRNKVLETVERIV